MTMHKNPHRVALSYNLVRSSSSEDRVLHPLFQMLDAVERRGSISAAARTLGLSYRHVWGELKRWEEEFDRLLIVWEKGQRARLTEFGQKLLWAERHAQSRLAPQISALRADLESAFGMAFDDRAHVLPVTASHDDAFSHFRTYAQGQGLFLDLRFSGSGDALSALVEGRASLAGFHFPAPNQVDERIRASLLEQFRGIVGQSHLHAVAFCSRSVGFIVEAGNPLKIRGLDDLLTGRYRFVNRPSGTGTRMFLDTWLVHHGKTGKDCKGYRYEEPSHAAVAEAVRNGAADLGLGLSFVAHARGLGFVPLFEEEYWLAYRRDGLSESGLSLLLNLITQQEWLQSLENLFGYRVMPSSSGTALSNVLL
jgi:putative molybdopterin biosynthesis protein